MTSPRLYSTFLLWMLSELFEKLPEIRRPDASRGLVFSSTKAHLLFRRCAAQRLMERCEQVVRPDPLQGWASYFRHPRTPLVDVPETVPGASLATGSSSAGARLQPHASSVR